MSNFGNVPSEIINMIPWVKEKHGDAADKLLMEIGDTCVSEFDSDNLSRRDWADRTATAIKLFNSFPDNKTTPWENASNVNLPMLAIAALQFQARAIDALIPPKGIVNFIPTGDEDIEKGERVKKYMDYQLLYEIEDFEDGMDRTMMQVPIIGSVFRKTYYDITKNISTSSYVSAADLVLSYYTKHTIEDCTRKTHILYQTVNDIRTRVRKGIYTEKAYELKEGGMTTEAFYRSTLKNEMDKLQGIKDASLFDKNRPRIILEQHRWWDLNDDGLEEPYIIWVDYETRMVLRITSRIARDFQGKEQTLEYFTHYFMFPNPEGFYGLGYNILLGGLNTAGNEIVNEVVDAGHLANMQGGFVSRRSGIKRGSLIFKRGEYKEVDTYVDDLKKAIWSAEFKGPNQTLYAVLGLLYEYSKLVSSVSETMTGQLPASDTPASTVMALIEEGRKVFSSVHKRIHRSFKKELKKLFRLNSIFLDTQVYFSVLGESNLPIVNQNGKPVLATTGVSDFSSSIDVIPVSDPNITSRAEKVMKAQTVFQTTLTSPVTATNQEAIYNAQRRFYEALEVHNIDMILPKPQTEIPDLSPEEENANIISEKPATSLIHQDHYKHIQVLEEMMQGPFGEQLSETGRKLGETHRRQHLSHLYMIQEQQKANAMAMDAATRGMAI